LMKSAKQDVKVPEFDMDAFFWINEALQSRKRNKILYRSIIVVQQNVVTRLILFTLGLQLLAS
jgi:hypothetical protein